MGHPLIAAPVDSIAAAFDGAEPLIEGLDLAEEALGNLAGLVAGDEAAFRDGEGWAARVTVDDTEVLVRGEGTRWGIYAPVGADAGDTMMAARRLHGLLGERDAGWDLDR